MTTNYDKGESFVTVNNVKLHYALEGDKTKPLLALINPASHNLTCWEVVMQDLLSHFWVLRFDIRGTGKSGWGADDEFTFSQYADDLAELMEALSLDSALVVGVAYGARTAARFGLRHADKVSGLGLFDVALTPPVEQAGQRELGAKAARLLQEAGAPIIERQKYWRFYEDRNAALQAHTAHTHEEDTSELLGQINKPILIACGRQDMNLAEAERIARHTAGAEFQVMEMTGHGSPFYRPNLFVKLLKGFAKKLPQGG